MFKIAVLGGGLMAQGIAEYFRRNPLVREFIIYDISEKNLEMLKPYLGDKGKIIQFDATNSGGLLKVLQEGKFDGVMNALPDILIPETTHTCIMAKLPTASLVGNDKPRKAQEKMHDMAVYMNASIIPACGLAPGIISDLGFWGQDEVKSAHTVKMFCGGLMQHPTGELRQAAFFNADDLDGLYDEYALTPWVIENGKSQPLHYLLPKGKVAFTDPEFSVTIDSALTHGAFDADPKLWQAPNVFYATLRYFGHFEKVRKAIRTKSKEECVKWLKENLSPAGEDLVALKVEVIGENQKFCYEMVDLYDKKTGLSAMKRCTGFPAAETLLQAIKNKWPAGVIHHEYHINIKRMIENLAQFGIRIRSYKTVKGEIIT